MATPNVDQESSVIGKNRSRGKLKRYFALIVASLTLTLSLAIWIGIAVQIISLQTVFIQHLPIAVLLGVLALVPSIEYGRSKQFRLWGMTTRTALVFVADRLFSQGQVFNSISFEISAVAIAIIWVFYTPLLWRTLVRLKENSN